MSIQIRSAQTTDLDTLIALQKDLEVEQAIWGFGADPREEWEGLDLDWIFVAEDDGRLVGYVTCVARPHKGECVFPEGSKIVEILELYVRPASRSRGVGHDLVRAVQSRARETGYTHLRLYSAAKRFDDVVRFYKDCGFTPWYLEMVSPLT